MRALMDARVAASSDRDRGRDADEAEAEARREADIASLLAADQLRLAVADASHPPSDALATYLQRGESVHDVAAWPPERYRGAFLNHGRACYMLCHRDQFRLPAQPSQPAPLAFVHTFRTSGAPSSSMAEIHRSSAQQQQVLGAADDILMLYSINAPHRGLRGLDVGRTLLARVMEEVPMRRYVTLSPVPGFRAWLEAAAADGSAAAALHPAVRAEVAASVGGGDARRGVAVLVDRAGSDGSAAAAGSLEARVVTALCAHYLTRVRAPSDPRSARNPVAHFHLRNGARLQRVLWAADPSPRRVAESLGVMVNYEYIAAELDANRRGYSELSRVAAAPELLSDLAAPAAAL